MKQVIIPVAILVGGCSDKGSDAIAPIISSYQSVEYTNPHPKTAVMLCIGQSNMTSGMLEYLKTMMLNAGFDEVQYVNVAVGGSKIARWMPSGDLFELIEEVSDTNYTHILVHQGESDYDNDNYSNMFLAMLQGIRDLGINAPLYLAQTSWLNNEIDFGTIRQQGELIDHYDDIHQGAMTDQLGEEYRLDGSHFNEAGLVAHADLWLRRLLK